MAARARCRAAGGADIHSFLCACADFARQNLAAGARSCPPELEWAGWRGGVGSFVECKRGMHPGLPAWVAQKAAQGRRRARAGHGRGRKSELV